jgi:N-acetylglucosaminyldiphosphoundecaprenol N-acetyl-beta-D-mannosaminyltransferase
MVVKKENNKINIFGINVSLLKHLEIEEKIKIALTNREKIFISTPNPEIILSSDNDEELFYILNKSDLAVADGIGLKMAAWLMGSNLHRWPGSVMTNWLLDYAQQKGYKVALLNLKGGLSTEEEIREAVVKKYPKLKFIVEPIDKEWSLPYYQSLNIFSPDIVLVGIGSPYQEKFIYHRILNLPFVKVAMGVGGTLDYLSGKVKPAPKLMVKFGLEWLWRLINIFSYTSTRKRLFRISRAIFVFPVKFLKWLVINPLTYRKNVACFLYKNNGKGQMVLVLERADEAGHYQLPQGGLDGQSLLSGGTRELQEEIGTHKFTPQKTYPNLYKYQFIKNGNRGFRNYKGQSQGLMIAKFIGGDNDIKINYWEFRSWKWVPVEAFVESVHPLRREAAHKFYEKFKQLDLKNK